MKFVIRAQVLIMIMVLLHTMCHAQPMLRFQPHIDANATLLGDVLQIENDTQHWAALPLQSHPTAGETITKEKIIGWMTQRLGQITWNWQGKTQISVKQLRQSSGNNLLDKAKTALINQLESKYTRVEITPLSHPKDSEYALDDFNAETTIAYPTAKRVCVWLTHDKQRIAVWFKVSAYAQVLVANQDVHYHTLIQDNAFSWQERNIAGLNNQPVQSLPKQAWLISSIQHGHILLASQLKEPPLVMQGQQVKVNVHNQNITVVMDAVALGDGYLGHAVTVKNPLNQKTFVALVSGLRQAEITS